MRYEIVRMSRYEARGGFLALFVVTLLGIVRPHAASAQIDWEAGADGLWGLPQGELDDNVSNDAIGISGYVARRMGKSPLLLGFEASFLQYGEESRTQSISTDIPEITVRVSTANRIVLTHFLARLESSTGRVRPYLDGYLGLGYFFTRSTVEGDAYEPIASSTNFEDWTSSFGLGGGLLVPIVTRDTPKGERDFELHFEARARYLFGGRAEYLTEGLLIDESGELSIDPYESRTDLLVLHFGVAFHF
jgi:hypothetical protein